MIVVYPSSDSTSRKNTKFCCSCLRTEHSYRHYRSSLTFSYRIRLLFGAINNFPGIRNETDSDIYLSSYGVIL